MRFAICDDDIQHMNELEAYFDSCKAWQIEAEPYESGEALIDAYREQGCLYDALFIDMEMDGLNGIETAKIIRSIDERVIIVFVTSYEEYAIESFQCSPLRFLTKPLKADKIDEALGAIHRLLTQKRETITFHENKSYVRLYCDEII